MGERQPIPGDALAGDVPTPQLPAGSPLSSLGEPQALIEEFARELSRGLRTSRLRSWGTDPSGGSFSGAG
ncbi:hypothetical protein GCM10010094_43640 [Streptomyces flaveus]|uniref:Uncharacterized protein n=1 Tax=Streptomyces flaveus TaxID=66370 RepID=A0A917VHF8_9ACTN|nr:hypothetical protein GCM10010094_43640 [Streptomyces flaveus]